MYPHNPWSRQWKFFQAGSSPYNVVCIKRERTQPSISSGANPKLKEPFKIADQIDYLSLVVGDKQFDG